MRKKQELADKDSCINRALDDEWTFVLLGRDKCAPVAIRAWVEARIADGKNTREDPQIKKALEVAAAMESEYDVLRSKLN